MNDVPKKQLIFMFRSDSISGLEELVQCSMCLERLNDSRMLPCQHTFCLSCLQSQFLANNLQSQEPPLEDIQTATRTEPSAIKCSLCKTPATLEQGFASLEKLPNNLHIDSMIKILEEPMIPVGNVSEKSPCSTDGCETLSDESEKCEHCGKIFCKICFVEHLSQLREALDVLVKKMGEMKEKLTHKLADFHSRCDQLKISIQEITADKIKAIKSSEQEALKTLQEIRSSGKVMHENLQKSMADLDTKLSPKLSCRYDASFQSLHKETSTLFRQVTNFGEARIFFDSENFRLEQQSEGIYRHERAPPENPTDLVAHYKSRQLVPKLVWNRCPRPAHIASPPWDPNLLYIAATDTHSVLILDRLQKKVLGRLVNPKMLYPQGIAISAKRREIYVSDKWEHCIHVFSDTGNYVKVLLNKQRVLSPGGLCITLDGGALIIADSGNNRILVINPETGQPIKTIGLIDNKTTLNLPLDVALFSDKLIVADTGNHRIKIFELDSGLNIKAFGKLGGERGEFRSAEAIAVDSLGFILVADAGNARIQVFSPEGKLVKILGRSDEQSFGWLSGIYVDRKLEIVTADSKNRCLQIF